MRFVRSKEEIDDKMCLAEVIHRLVEADEVPERADVPLRCGDPVLRYDWFIAKHNYWAPEIDFETMFREHADPRRCLIVHWHNVGVF